MNLIEHAPAQPTAQKFNIDQVMAEFALVKQEARERNEQYYLNRQAVKGNFRWPRAWPNHIPKVNHNMCKPIVERHSTYLMGRGFNWNVDRPNTLDMRDAAERAEKILKRLFELSTADVQFSEGAKVGSKLGRTVFKVYKKGKPGREHACFTYCQPDYFYGVPLGPESPGEFAIVYYSYPLDVGECRRRYGNKAYKSEREMAEADRYIPLKEQRSNRDFTALRDRRIPVLEVWTKEQYALIVGGVEIYNGPNPFKWTDGMDQNEVEYEPGQEVFSEAPASVVDEEEGGEGFIPFVVIENIRNDEEGFGESDIAQARVLNERLNYLFSRREHLAERWLTPTLVWEGAPQNYAEILTSSLEGGGAIPTRLGSRLYFLAYDRDNPQVLEQISSLQKAVLDVAGMNAAAFEGAMQGSMITGPIGHMQLQPMLSTVEKKQSEWAVGLRKLCAMLLQVQESIGDSDVLGEAVIGASRKSAMSAPSPAGAEGAQYDPDGQVVDLSGADIKGLRSVTISWPGVLPKDDYQAAQLEMEKTSRGFQSVYTLLEKLGEEFPMDEIARIREENNDPSLRGEKVAEQMRAQAPLIRQQMQGDQQAQMQQQQMAMQMAMQQGQGQQPQGPPPPEGGDFPLGDQGPPDKTGIAERLRAMQMARQASTEGDFPVHEVPG